VCSDKWRFTHCEKYLYLETQYLWFVSGKGKNPMLDVAQFVAWDMDCAETLESNLQHFNTDSAKAL
jgi:hypothetical protein